MREAPSKVRDVDEIAPLTSWEDTHIRPHVQTDTTSPARASFHISELHLDDEARAELSDKFNGYQFRVFDVDPRPVIIVYEDGEEPMELARWVMTYQTNMRAINEGWDEERREAALPRPYWFYSVDGGAMFLVGTQSAYAQDAALEYRAARLLPNTWGWERGATPRRPMSMREKRRGASERTFFSFWRPWISGGTTNGVHKGGTQDDNRPSTWGEEVENPEGVYDLACEVERAQLGALVMEWADSPEAKKFRKAGARRINRVADVKRQFGQLYRTMYTLREDQVDEILEEWIPRLKKLSLIKTQDRD